jgi:hypothetical protein
MSRTVSMRQTGKLSDVGVQSALEEELVRTRFPGGLSVDTQIQIRVHVPTGGDYSGMALPPHEFEFSYVVEWTEEVDE